MTIVTFGDSTTEPRDELVTYSQLLAEELPERGIRARVVNAGVGGNSTDMARERFECDVLRESSDFVIIQFGINDAAVDVWKEPPSEKPRVSLAQYEKNLRTFVRTLKRRGAKVILMTPNPMRWTPSLKELYGKPPYDTRSHAGFNVTLCEYVESVRRIAREEDIPLVDVYAAYEAYDKTGNQSADDLLLDGMHPTDKGHRLVADLLIPAICSATAR